MSRSLIGRPLSKSRIAPPARNAEGAALRTRLSVSAQPRSVALNVIVVSLQNADCPQRVDGGQRFLLQDENAALGFPFLPVDRTVVHEDCTRRAVVRLVLGETGDDFSIPARSEERRVGKECRSR